VSCTPGTRGRAGAAALLAAATLVATVAGPWPAAGGRPQPALSGVPGIVHLAVAGQRVTADIADAPADRVLAALAVATGTRIAVDVAATTTARFRDLPVEEAVRRLVPDAGLVFLYAGSRLTDVLAFGSSSRSAGSPGDADSVRSIDEGDDLDLGPTAGDGDPGPDDATALDEEGASGPSGELDAEVDALAALARRLREDPDPAVRQSAAIALGDSWSETAVAALEQALQDDADADVREAAGWALGETWSEEAVEPLRRALQADPVRGVREAAVRALAELASRDATPALVAALSDADVSVREAVAETLGAVGAAEALPRLADVAARDSSVWVRDAAADAVGRPMRPR
jgi:hypothetical protein